MIRLHAIPSLLLLAALGVALSAHGQLRVRSATFQVGPNPSAIAAVDITGDGWPEIITADRGTLSDLREERPANDELSLLIAQGDLKYQKHHPSLKTGFGPYAIAVANIDAHRWPDILVASFHATRRRDLSLFLNLQDDGIYKPVYVGIPGEKLNYFRHVDGDGVPLFHKPGLTDLQVGDINGDGIRDVVTVGWGSDSLICLDGDPEDYFAEPRIYDLEGGPFGIVLADFNGDRNLDVAVSLMTTNQIAILEGDGTGEFREVQRFPSRGRLPHRLRRADMNQDGELDLLVSHRFTDDSVVIFFGAGDFTFPTSQEILLGTDRDVLEHEIRDFAIGDFNQDKVPDLAIACFESAEIAIMTTSPPQSNGFLRFSRKTHRFAEGKPRALCVADFDQDEKEDVAVALWGLNAVGLLLHR